MAGGVPSGSAPESRGKEAEEDEELTTNPFWGLVWAEDDRRGGSTMRGGATVHVENILAQHCLLIKLYDARRLGYYTS